MLGPGGESRRDEGNRVNAMGRFAVDQPGCELLFLSLLEARCKVYGVRNGLPLTRANPYKSLPLDGHFYSFHSFAATIVEIPAG